MKEGMGRGRRLDISKWGGLRRRVWSLPCSSLRPCQQAGLLLLPLSFSAPMLDRASAQDLAQTVKLNKLR